MTAGYADSDCADLKADPKPGPNWAEYLAGGLVNEDEARCLESLSKIPIAHNDSRIWACCTILGRQVSQEVIKYILDLLVQPVHRLSFDDQSLGQHWMENLYNLFKQFEKTSIHIRVLFLMSRLVRENSNSVVDCSTFLNICRQTLQTLDPELCIEALSAMTNTLEVDHVRLRLSQNERLIDAIKVNLATITNQPQLQYNALLCLWLVSFNATAVTELLKRSNILPITMSIAKTATKEKVLRVAVGFWRNCLERCKETVMPVLIGARVLDFISNCEKKQFSDPDLTFDLSFLKAELDAAILKLSTFDEYSSEIKSGNLDWTPPHKSTLFWRTNAMRLNENNGELLR